MLLAIYNHHNKQYEYPVSDNAVVPHVIVHGQQAVNVQQFTVKEAKQAVAVDKDLLCDRKQYYYQTPQTDR